MEKVSDADLSREAATAADGGGGGGDKESEMDVDDLVLELLVTVETVQSFSDYRRTQRKECHNLIRRMKLAVPLLEEIRDLEIPVPDDVCARLYRLRTAFTAAKKLLRCCHDGSKIYLALESEAVMNRFHFVNEKLTQAVDGMPYDGLCISDEAKEQLELMCSQLKRAKGRTDTQDMELAMDLMVLLSQKEEDRNANSCILERLAKKLDLHSLPDLGAEAMAIKMLIKERSGQNIESTQQIISLLSKFKQNAGIEDCDGLNEIMLPKYLEKCPSLMIPNDFLCPISLEIMTDPVIIATGQTYERSSIQKWLDAGHRNCPKTRQPLAHLSLAPNYALRNVISQWCMKNKVELMKKDSLVNSKPKDHKEEIETLVQDLSSLHLDVQRKAVKRIRMLSKENPENRILIAKCGGVPSLVSLLSYPDSKIQENTVTALLNLSIDETNKQLITKAGAIPPIIGVLKGGTMEARENSAAALFSLSMLDENKVLIGDLNGIPPLIDLLQNGTLTGKKDATIALFNLCLNSMNKTRAIKAGIVKPLLQVLDDKQLAMIDEALSIILLLSTQSDGRAEIGELSYIEKLVGYIRDGAPKTKECALSVLLELCTHKPSFLLVSLQFGVYEHLCEVAESGTQRAQRKANSLLQLMRKTGQIL
ncbi:hypothetical protein KFK09_020298 [Dendrobium nobile]|uniref:RING-type E3 ubiquitin transferase n=1 Tax=Dendrobium nobile TaxID=94219 RepID=A0A8T3AYY6_DENNO|nr:hypothetical protein KFK09_020298 [Dendrobium nobile]